MENKTATKKKTTNTETKEIPVVYGTIVNCNNLNVRKEPNIASEIVTVFCAGTKLLIKSVIDGWYEVEGGYVNGNYIQLGE